MTTYLMLFKNFIEIETISKIFNDHKGSLEFTIEECNKKGEIQFLDLLIIIRMNGICWRNQQRKMKGILPIGRNHSKCIKVGVAKGILRSAVLKSCCHRGQVNLNTQVKRLYVAGYPRNFITQQFVRLAISMRSEEDNHKEKWNDKRKSIVVQ
jgi:hypothetical protein